MLSAISKKIIKSRLEDKGIFINESDLDNYIIATNSFTDCDSMYNFIVDNFGKLMIT